MYLTNYGKIFSELTVNEYDKRDILQVFLLNYMNDEELEATYPELVGKSPIIELSLPDAEVKKFDTVAQRIVSICRVLGTGKICMPPKKWLDLMFEAVEAKTKKDRIRVKKKINTYIDNLISRSLTHDLT